MMRNAIASALWWIGAQCISLSLRVDPCGAQRGLFR